MIDNVNRQNILAEFTITRKEGAIFKRDDRTYKNITVCKKIYRESVKRNILENVVFKNAAIIRSAFSGSKLYYVNFYDTHLKGNAWTSCTFTECEFLNFETIYTTSSNFSFSSFYNCKFKNISFIASSFIKSQFIDCIFESCTIASSTLENALFHRCKFLECDLGRTNLEFCEFRDCVFKNSVLPLYQICFTIGGVEHALNLSNEIFLRSSKGKYAGTNLYIFYEKMKDYYSTLKQYFALANIALINNDIENAKNVIFEGIEYYLLCQNFRMIKHLCRLGKAHGILTVKQSREILDKTDKALINYKGNPAEISDYIMHAADLREFLYDYTETESTMTIEIQTNIKPEETEKINNFINKISSVLDEYDETAHSIQIRHNSPFLLFCSIVGTVEALFSITKNLIKLGKFIYKTVKNKHHDDNNNPPTQPVNYTFNISGGLEINGDVNFFNYLSNNIQDYKMNDEVNCVSSKIVSERGAIIYKMERKD